MIWCFVLSLQHFGLDPYLLQTHFLAAQHFDLEEPEAANDFLVQSLLTASITSLHAPPLLLFPVPSWYNHGQVFAGLHCSLCIIWSRCRSTLWPSIFTSIDQAMKLASP